jgi:ABC-type amino acid transport substrate-binding protein
MKELVSIVMGSDSDLETMQECADVLKDFGVRFDMQVLSAHRTPSLVADFATQALKKGRKVIIAGAGGAAHLAGAVAANTILPVIGVPLAATQLSGFDALLATDACRSSGGDRGCWKTRCAECGSFGHTDPEPFGCKADGETQEIQGRDVRELSGKKQEVAGEDPKVDRAAHGGLIYRESNSRSDQDRQS